MAENTVKNGVTCLQERGMEARHEQIVRSDYNKDNQYGATHPDAISDGDPQGKGTNHGGHTFTLPDCTKPTSLIDYSNFDTQNGGGLYDIEGREGHPGRKQMMVRSLYSADNQYGAMLVNTAENIADGQAVLSW